VEEAKQFNIDTTKWLEHSKRILFIIRIPKKKGNGESGSPWNCYASFEVFKAVIF